MTGLKKPQFGATFFLVFYQKKIFASGLHLKSAQEFGVVFENRFASEA